MAQPRKVQKPGRKVTPGVVIRERKESPREPRIIAFIWGWKVRPVPTLPYGRWKPSAA